MADKHVAIQKIKKYMHMHVDVCLIAWSPGYAWEAIHNKSYKTLKILLCVILNNNKII